MCPRKDGVNIDANLLLGGTLYATRRHFCPPESVAEGKALGDRMLWGLTAAIFDLVPGGQQFNLMVSATGLFFFEEPADTFKVLPASHPLMIHRGVFNRFVRPRGAGRRSD